MTGAEPALSIRPLQASAFRSDGGAMFGLVPKGIWSRMIEPDERNTIAQHAHVLLVTDDAGRKGLVDTGCGPFSRLDQREQFLHGLESGWPLVEELTRLGIARGDIDFILLTHLHWDHAGGLLDEQGEAAFPAAEIFLHADEWEDARSGSPLLGKAYPPEPIRMLERMPSGQLHLVHGDGAEILPGLRMERTGGHTRGHSAAVFQSSRLAIEHPAADQLGQVTSAVFPADVCPTRHHFRLVFQAAYDTFPLQTRAWKLRELPRFARERTLLLFDHDPDFFGMLLEEKDGSILPATALPAP